MLNNNAAKQPSLEMSLLTNNPFGVLPPLSGPPLIASPQKPSTLTAKVISAIGESLYQQHCHQECENMTDQQREALNHARLSFEKHVASMPVSDQEIKDFYASIPAAPPAFTEDELNTLCDHI